MNPAPLFRLLAAGIVLGLSALPPSALACAACFGASDDSMAKGMNMGIFTLLVVIVSVLAGLAAFGIFLVRRSARLAAASSMTPVSSAQLSQPVSQLTH